MHAQTARGHGAVQQLADPDDENPSIPLLVQQHRTGEEDRNKPTQDQKRPEEPTPPASDHPFPPGSSPLSRAISNSLATLGLAFPRLAFMIMPTRKVRLCTFPFR